MKIYNLVRYVLEEKIKHNEYESNEFSSIADYFNSHTIIKERTIIKSFKDLSLAQRYLDYINFRDLYMNFDDSYSYQIEEIDLDKEDEENKMEYCCFLDNSKVIKEVLVECVIRVDDMDYNQVNVLKYFVCPPNYYNGTNMKIDKPYTENCMDGYTDYCYNFIIKYNLKEDIKDFVKRLEDKCKEIINKHFKDLDVKRIEFARYEDEL